MIGRKGERLKCRLVQREELRAKGRGKKESSVQQPELVLDEKTVAALGDVHTGGVGRADLKGPI